MRYLLLSDIHSNLEALEACLASAAGRYDQIACLGDLVGYGPDPNAVVEILGPAASVTIRGNHDRVCSGLEDAVDFNPVARRAAAWTQDELTPEHSRFLRALPGGPVQLEGFQIVHGSPRDEDEYIVGLVDASPLLNGAETQTVCFGHTHIQGGFRRTARGRTESIRLLPGEDGLLLHLLLEQEYRYLVNPGSVGQPRDGDRRAAFAIHDTEQHVVEYFRVSYDLPKTQKKMRQAGLPQLLIDRLSYGR